jgi:hypothetical protein
VKIFQFAILRHPTEDGKKAGKKSEILVPITDILANDLAQAQIHAARAIPKNALEDLDRVEVAVRPF